MLSPTRHPHRKPTSRISKLGAKRRHPMIGLSSRIFPPAVAVALLVFSPFAGAQSPSPPDFTTAGWLNENPFHGGEFLPVAGSPPLFHQDPAHPFVANNSGAQPTYRIADLSN